MLLRQAVHDAPYFRSPLFLFLVSRRFIEVGDFRCLFGLINQMLHSSGRSEMIVDLVTGDRSQPAARITDVCFRISRCSNQRQDRFADDIFGKMQISTDACVHKPPHGWQVAFCQMLNRRRLLLAQSLDEK